MGETPTCNLHSGVDERLDDLDEITGDHETRIRTSEKCFVEIRDNIKTLKYLLLFFAAMSVPGAAEKIWGLIIKIAGV